MDEPIYLALVALTISATYAAYVGFLVLKADCYSRSQKIAQVILAILIPFLGPLWVHLFLKQHLASPVTPDRNFVPQRDPAPDELPRTHVDGI